MRVTRYTTPMYLTDSTRALQLASAVRAVRRRLQAVKSMFGREGGGLTVGPKRYFFSGPLKCSACGGSIALVSGRGRHGADRYGCSVHHQRGDSVCENAALVRRDELEQSLLKGLADSVVVRTNSVQPLFNAM